MDHQGRCSSSFSLGVLSGKGKIYFGDARLPCPRGKPTITPPMCSYCKCLMQNESEVLNVPRGSFNLAALKEISA